MKAASGIHTKYTLTVESVTVICYAKRYSFATVTASGEWVLHPRRRYPKTKMAYRKGMPFLFGAGDGI